MNVKNRIKSGLSAALVLLAVSCSQDDALQTTVNDTDGLVPVTLSATIDHGVQTLAATSETDDDATRCVLQIMEGDNIVENKEMTLGNDGKYTASVYLNANNTYTFLFWADGGDTYYNADDLTTITAATTADKVGIAWHGKATWSSSESTTIEATLTHAVTKVSLKTTTDVASGTTIAVTLPTTYTGYNVDTEAVAAQSTGETTFSYTTTEEVTGTTDGAEIFSFYALVNDDTQTLMLQTEDQPEVTINSVPLAPNKHVILSGDVTYAGLTEYTFAATINEDWASTESIFIIPSDAVTITATNCSDINGDGNYVVSGTFNSQITITNSDVTATAGMRAAAIGFSCSFTSSGNSTYCSGKITITTDNLDTFLSHLNLNQGMTIGYTSAQKIGKGQQMSMLSSTFRNTDNTGSWEGVVINDTAYPNGYE